MGQKAVLTEKDVEIIITDTIGDRLKSIEESMKDISEIKRVLLGDGVYSKTGLKEQHDQMYRAFSNYQDDEVSSRVKILWDRYQIRKNSKLDDKIDEIIETYTSAKWTSRKMGITTFTALLSLILAIGALLKLFGII